MLRVLPILASLRANWSSYSRLIFFARPRARRDFLVHWPHGYDLGKNGVEYALAQWLLALALLLTSQQTGLNHKMAVSPDWKDKVAVSSISSMAREQTKCVKEIRNPPGKCQISGWCAGQRMHSHPRPHRITAPLHSAGGTADILSASDLVGYSKSFRIQ
jgi:hypothetical protein